MKSKRAKAGSSKVGGIDGLPREGRVPASQAVPNGANDVLLGATELREFINTEVAATPLSRSQIYHLVETHSLPAGRLGGRLIASKSKIRERFAELAAGSVGPELPSPPTRTRNRLGRSSR
jgi:hypothetical protein